MEAVSFGWAIGDIRAIIQTIHDLVRLFRGAHGAQDHFVINAAWLQSFAHDLQRVHVFMSKKPDATCIQGLQEKLLLIDAGYTQFEQYLDKFDVFLPQPIPAHTPCQRRWRAIRTAKQSLRWSWKEVNGKVDDLKLAVSMPLAEMSLILLLELCTDVGNVYQRVDLFPNVVDITEIKDMVENQMDKLREISTTADEINKVISHQARAFIAEEDDRYEKQYQFDRALYRLGRIEGHLLHYESAVDLMQTGIANNKSSNERRARSTELLQALVTGQNEALQNLFALVILTLKKVDDWQEDMATINELKEGAVQTMKDVKELQDRVRETRRASERESIERLLLTGVSIASAATGVATLFSGLLQKKWETAVSITASSKTDSDIASFEAKWKTHITSSGEAPVSNPPDIKPQSGTHASENKKTEDSTK